MFLFFSFFWFVEDLKFSENANDAFAADRLLEVHKHVGQAYQFGISDISFRPKYSPLRSMGNKLVTRNISAS